MLDAETKARIDSARDILVGKVPDPKSQVEQITIALIYKFMDDMDRQSEELGGKATFFTGEFKKYRWGHLLDRRLGGHERLLLYAEGIEKMNENANIPQLFRDIFNGVFLPYRDPETLNLFLKEINGFSYDHSERLGDAYEYLLNILGIQGDAGQFRTPRHIIDFIVTIVDPQKHETVLDPACGTAGFLISAFKHILKKNLNLSPDDRGRLMTNFAGYDIAPDMVRLSRVNMYLHGFPNPTIHEYDALTSEERWDDRYDIIMTNPPFMTPKGGIRPHNRFAIKAKRSEVLFVDYITEHLNPGGRAGIIVPEGIIFQRQNAYKNLRRMLVENYLWAVVSLPGGVFNPYSGVKTSILFLDKNMAKRTNDILFVKVMNDGFDLGAQRRPIEGSELPEALNILNGHKRAQKAQEGKMALTVSREHLLESPDCNLSGDRYRAVALRGNGQWPLVQLDEVCSFEYGISLPKRQRVPGPYPVIGSNGVTGFHNAFSVKGPTIVVGRKGSAGKVTWIEQDCTPIDTTYYVTVQHEAILLRYLFYILQGLGLTELRGGAGIPGLNRNDAYKKAIPLPPLEEQERIVAEVDGYRKVIEAARQVISSYKPTVPIDSTWPLLAVGDVVEFISGITLSIPKCEDPSGIPILSINNVSEDGELILDGVRTVRVPGNKKANTVQKGDLLFNWRNGSRRLVGKTALWTTGERHIFGSFLLGIRPSAERIDSHYLWVLLNSFRREGRYQQMMRQNVNGLFNRAELKSVEIPVPPLATQQEIVAGIKAERTMVESNRKLIDIFGKKILAKLADVWGEETSRGEEQ